MKTDLFDFDLPRDLIADRPVSPRDAAKMLVVSDDLADRVVNELPDLLRAGDVMVFNDTRVIPARLSGIRRAERGQSNAEITLLKPTDDGAWLALAKPAKRLRAGDVIEFIIMYLKLPD